MSTRELAEWVSSLSYDDLPESTILKAKSVVFDCLGASIFTGCRKQWGKTIAEYASIHGGGQPEATIIASGGRKTLASQAALANGTMAEGFELGDVHPGTATRPFPMILPAALALAETRKRCGKALIEAIVAGYEVNTRIATAIAISQRGRPMLSRGLYVPSLIGTFGGTAAAGKVIGLPVKEMTWAFGIAGALTGGYFQGHEEGAWTRRLNGGMTPSRAVTAALLGERGFVGPERPLEGEYGFYRVFANGEYDPQVLVDGLGQSYKIEETWLKTYPMNSTLHSSAEALLTLIKANGLRHADIAEIKASFLEYVPILSKKDVKTVVSAQFSMPFALAVAAVRGKVTVDEFEEKVLTDTDVLAMIQRVNCAYDAELVARAGLGSQPGRVTVTMRDGRSFTQEVLYPKGHPKNPMNVDELKAKFKGLTAGFVSETDCDRIYDLVINLDTASDIAPIMELCGAPHPERPVRAT
ncbi:MAG: MmgE/PrpD family protein [Betaproteobacteria bacterium]|nr:MmgE/PrpD family protein [Betaproteobacteria bacterium]